MNNFDALMLIDCWDERWIKKEKPTSAREFYARIMDFTENLDFNQVFFCSSVNSYNKYSNPTEFTTHHWLEEFYKKHKYVYGIKDLNTHIDKGSSILVGGGSWQGCLHKKNNMNLKILREHYDVVSHPIIVADQFLPDRITENDFTNDPIIRWVAKENGFFLAPRITPSAL